MKSFLLTLLFFSLVSLTAVSAQNRLQYYDFDDGMLSGWSNEGNARNSTDGTVSSEDLFWNGRPAIASASGNEAAMIWGAGGSIRTPGFQNFTAAPELYLAFHQYFRKFTGDTYLNIYQDGNLEERILLNDRLNEGVETAHFDTVIVNLTAYKDFNALQIEFEQEADGYFWLIDDVAFWDGLPTPQTVPDTMGNYLAANGYPYEIDSANWAYVPYQVVVQFNPDSTDQDFRDSLREANGAILKEACACDNLELWEIDGSAFAVDASGTPFPTGGSTNVQSNKIGRGTRGKVDGVDLNYYNGVLLQPQPIGPGDSLSTDSLQNLLPRRPDALKIAILDTGIDYQHDDLRDFVRTSSDALENGEDEDGNCLLNDPIGWNFVADNNNPYDDNSHGTHVAGIIADSLRQNTSACDFEFIAYKTHDNNGISTLFDVACATFQAIEDEVDLINDSWGFFGDSSTILANAIDSAYLAEILIISAAGNDATDLDESQQYPACYNDPNLITVGATETFIDPNENNLEFVRPAFFTNFSPTYVDVMANGTDVVSYVPGNLTATKSGTSMATPIVTAAAALTICAKRDAGTPSDNLSSDLVRTSLLNCIGSEFLLRNAADMGRFLQLEELAGCITSTDTPEPITVKLYPNPTVAEVWLESPEPLGAGDVRLLNLQGQVVYLSTTPVLPAEVPQRLGLPDLPPGIYLLQLRADGRAFTAKIVLH